MYSQGVFVQVNHLTLGSAKSSGFKVGNIVITHGSLLAPLLLSNRTQTQDIREQYISIIKELQNTELYRPKVNSCFTNRSVINFKVLSQNCTRKSFLSSKSVGINNKETINDYNVEKATLCLLFNYKGTPEILNEISNWCYADAEDSEIHQLNQLLVPTFIFLMVGKSSKDAFEKELHLLYKATKNTLLYPGLPLVVESTPFGNFSFVNSWSLGIVSKVIGAYRDGIVTDARLVDGCEGAPIYTFEKGCKGVIIGLITQTISWCNGEWVGFSLGLSINHLLREVLGLQSSDYIPFNKLKLELPASSLNIDKLSSSIVFVRCQNKWGSGVVIDEALGFIISCSHIIDNNHDSVRVVFGGDEFSASVVYASPPSASYDLALLSVGKVPGLKALMFAEEPPRLGERVMAAGYPLSTESLVRLNQTPTVSAGCVSKISVCGGPLQTTCCTQSGLSGGALLRPPDQLLGVIVSNVKLCRTTMPHFSFAVNIHDVRKALQMFIRSKDTWWLQSLCLDNVPAQMEWNLVDCKL